MDIAPRVPPGHAGSDGKPQSNRKKRKDPAAPKRASNAYMIFCKERRSQLKNENPDMPFGQLGKKLGDMWRTMSAEEKRPYEDRASGDRDRYKGEMNQYQSNVMMKQVNAATGGSAGSVSQSQSQGTPDDGEGEGDGELDGEGDDDNDNDHDPHGQTEGEGEEEPEEGHSAKKAKLNNGGENSSTAQSHEQSTPNAEQAAAQAE